jgi:hypothetical protein
MELVTASRPMPGPTLALSLEIKQMGCEADDYVGSYLHSPYIFIA